MKADGSSAGVRVFLASLGALLVPAPAPARAQAPPPPPVPMPGSLAGVPVPPVFDRITGAPLVPDFVQDVGAAVRLGKALFWDMQAGSDGQACASCHFHAGADS